MEYLSSYCIGFLDKYRNHIFVFLVTLFIALTLAHPSVLLNDEFITTNQLHQLQAGHQILINEGKYGLQQNGSMSGYFAYKSNLLGYTLFYPLISLPAYWMIDLSGENCVYLILCLWTMVMLTIILLINRYYPSFSYYRNFRWTSFAIGGIFILFFVNLFFYATFPVDPYENYPEVIAIVFTNMFLLSLTSVIIYEINRTIFENNLFSFFGTIVCLFSSSYFLWATHCKDHILLMPVFAAIFLCLIRFALTQDLWYFPLAFLVTGLLAWIRPELALWEFIAVGLVCIYYLMKERSSRSRKDLLFLLLSPLFTIIGALPFFLNNMLITKNFLLPVSSIYLSEKPSLIIVNSTQQLVPATGVKSVTSIIGMFAPNLSVTPQSFITDLSGITFYPTTGSASITAVIPLFVVMAILGCGYLFSRRIEFSSQEKQYIIISLWISISVFLAYASVIHILNTDHGISPDIRYLSPLYLPLTITGLIILNKMKLLPEKPSDSIKWMFVICISGLVLSLIFLPMAYGPGALSATVNLPLGKFFSIFVLALSLITLAMIPISRFISKGKEICMFLIFLLCSIPFIWQVNATFVFRSFSAFSGYTFWIPVSRVVWELIVNFILIKSVIP